jgi:hypothetical protein
MPIDSINSFFDLPAIQAEFAAIKNGLGESQSSLVGLYNVIKGFKDTSISTLAANTDQLSTAINGSVQAVGKAKTGYDELTQKITAQVKAVNESITSITENSEAYDQLIKQAVKNKIANDELAASANALKKAYQGGQTSLYQYQQSLADIKEAQVSLKTSNADVTRALNNMEKQAQSSSGSLDQLRAKLGELNMAYDKLSETERGSTQGQGLLKTIQTTDQALKQLEGSTGRFQRNVGNYAESLNPAFDSVKEQLESINKELAAMEARGKASVQNVGNTIGFKTAAQRQAEGLSGQAAAGPTNLAGGSSQVTILNQDTEAYQKLTLQQKVLEGALQRQTIGFKTANQEMRSVRNTLDTMTLAGLQDTEAFEKLGLAYAQNEQKIKDLHREQTILTGDAPAITALTGVAKGLGGAYAVGAGAAQLLASGDEKLDKELNHLVAIMTLLQGLEEAVAVLKDKNAIATALETEANKALNTVKAIEVAILGKSKAAKAAEAAAKALNTTATEENTVATVANAEATEGLTVATEGAEVATIGLRTALVATGIGAIIIAVGVLVAKIIEWSQAENKAAENSAALAEAMAKVNEILMARIELSDEDAEHTKKNLEDALALSEKNKESYNNLYSVKKAQADLDQKTAENDLKKAANTEDIGAAYRSVEGDVKRLSAGLDPLLSKQQQLVDIGNIWLLVQQKKINSSEAYLQIYQKYGTATTAEDAKDQLESVEKEIAATKTVIDAKKKMRDAYNQSQINQEALTIEQIQHEAEEERKRALETGLLIVNGVKDRNAKILADARSTSAQRLAAIKSDRDQEIRAAQLERNSLDPSAAPQEVLIADAKLHAAQDQARRDFAQKTRQEKRKEYEKDRDARLEIFRQANAESQAAEEDVLGRKIGHEERDTTGDKKLQALSAQYQEQKNLSDQNRREDLDAEGLNQEQKLAINKKYDVELEDLQLKYLHNQQSIQKEILAATLSDLEQYYQDRETEINKNSNKELAALEKRLAAGKISEEKYRELRRREEEAHAQDLIDNQVLKDYSVLQSTKSGTKEQSDAQAKLTKDLGTQQDTRSGNAQADKDERLKHVQEEAEKIYEVSQNASKSVEDLVSIGYNRQVIDLENLEKRQARAYTVEQKQIEDSSASQEQKSLRMKILDDQQQAQNEKNARKQRQLDIEKAKFDKAKSIFDIITGTAVAVVKSLPNIPLAVSVGILGAAELAEAIAQPLPKYKQGAGFAGRPAHKGGLGVVGDAFVPELIAEPGKAPFWSPAVPSVLDMAPGARIYPPEEINRMISSGMFVNQFGIIQQKETNRDMMEIKQAIVWQTGRIERALAKNKPKVVNNIKLDAKFGNHIHKSVFQ